MPPAMGCCSSPGSPYRLFLSDVTMELTRPGNKHKSAVRDMHEDMPEKNHSYQERVWWPDISREIRADFRPGLNNLLGSNREVVQP